MRPQKVCPIINFKTLKLVEVRVNWPEYLVIKELVRILQGYNSSHVVLWLLDRRPCGGVISDQLFWYDKWSVFSKVHKNVVVCGWCSVLPEHVNDEPSRCWITRYTTRSGQVQVQFIKFLLSSISLKKLVNKSKRHARLDLDFTNKINEKAWTLTC